MRSRRENESAAPIAVTRTELLVLASIVGVGLILRLWALGAKGLSYDEAATALMARATPVEILTFHWHATYEHPPLWQLIMHFWSLSFGQSEAMLRLLPALAGTLAIAATWWWLRTMWPTRCALRLVTAGLVATGPVLTQYSQDARPYALMLLSSALSLTATVYLIQRPSWRTAMGFILVTWFCTGLHYYGLILFGVQAFFLVGQGLLHRANRRAWGVWAGALLLGVLPIGAWILLAPGFRMTLELLAASHRGERPDWGDNLMVMGRNLTVASLRWSPPPPYWFLLLLPLIGIGAVTLVYADLKARAAPPWSVLVLLVPLSAFLANGVIFELMNARYVLFVTLALYALVAAAIVWLWRLHPIAGTISVCMVAAVAVLGAGLYFGAYQKSEYRDMAAFLRSRHEADDGVILYTPRQHLLAKYYLPGDWAVAPMPAVILPPFWPVSPPRVKPEVVDGQIQALLKAHPVLWLLATGEVEVDSGEFVPKYLTAVAYEDECWAWIDVYLCRYRSPHFVTPQIESTPAVLFNGELRLAQAAVTQISTPEGERTILATLDWVAEHKPALDYRVTLRLVAADGTVVAQRDEFPIGPLLPPSTWAADDHKPGYMALSIPASAPPGEYRLMVGLYDPNTLASFGDLVELAALNLED